jgi:hypothetical protein
MLTYLIKLRDLISEKITDDFTNWVVSNPVNYAMKFCELTNEVNNEMIRISINAISKMDSSNFWKEEWHFDKKIQREVREQEILRRHIQRLIDDYVHEYDVSKLSDEDLIKLANQLIENDFRYDIISNINAFEISRKREKYYKRQKGRFLKRKRKSLINFREFFRKLYSFHFKNLDDEHDLAYTNLGTIS